MADDNDAHNDPETDEQELIRLRSEEQHRIQALQSEQQARQTELDKLDQAERDRSELMRLRSAETHRLEQENALREYGQWQSEQARLRDAREQETLNQEDTDRLAQTERDRIDLIRLRNSEHSQHNTYRPRFSNQFESTSYDTPGGMNLSSSIMQMTQELNKNSSIWSHATLRCNPCIPSAGSDIVTRFDFDLWKSEWFSLLDTAPSLSEIQKMSLFMRSSGIHIREILTGLSIDNPDDSSSPTPYSDMMTKLEKHFNSEANQKLEAMIFRSTMQGQGESNVEFIRRLLKKVRFCGFSNTMFELIATVAQNTTDPRLRLKALDPECDYTKLMTYATTLQLNSNIEKVKESAAGRQLEVNAVQSQRNAQSNPYTLPVGNSSWSKPARDPSRAQDRSTSRYKQQPPRTRMCFRCGEDASTHHISNCTAFHKICSHCGKKGHVSKACKSKAAGIPPIKREPSSFQTDTKKAKINEVSSETLHSEPSSEVSPDDDLIYE